jgi:hypothetical protein
MNDIQPTAGRAVAAQHEDDHRHAPSGPTILELLDQTEWWKPQRGPMIRVEAMTDTHRLHTAAWLFKRAESLAAVMAMHVMSGPGPSGDAACDDLDGIVGGLLDHHDEWMRETELFGALLADLPTPAQAEEWADLLARAKHWSTCPRNAILAAPFCTCTPVENGLDSAKHFAARLAGATRALPAGSPS